MRGRTSAEDGNLPSVLCFPTARACTPKLCRTRLLATSVHRESEPTATQCDAPFKPQVCPYDPCPRAEYLAAATAAGRPNDDATRSGVNGSSSVKGGAGPACTTASAAATAAGAAAESRENDGWRQQEQPELRTKAGHEPSEDDGGAGRGPGGGPRPPARVGTGSGVGGSCVGGGGGDDGGRGGGSDGSAAAHCAGAPPFARLRERTFDMTKRGELTSANVWYATMRKDQGVTVAGGGGGGGGGDGGRSGCEDVEAIKGASRNKAEDGAGGAGGDGGGGDGGVGADGVRLAIP